LHNYSTSGTFESKFRYYLKLRGHHHIFYGVYRTEQLKRNVYELISAKNQPTTTDLAIMLSLLRFGDFYVIDELLMYRYDGGTSSQGFFNYKNSQKMSFSRVLSHNYPFTKWCFEKFGFTICLKNLDLFLLWNLEPVFFLIVNIIRKISYNKTEFRTN